MLITSSLFLATISGARSEAFSASSGPLMPPFAGGGLGVKASAFTINVILTIMSEKLERVIIHSKPQLNSHLLRAAIKTN